MVNESGDCAGAGRVQTIDAAMQNPASTQVALPRRPVPISIVLCMVWLWTRRCRLLGRAGMVTVSFRLRELREDTKRYQSTAVRLSRSLEFPA